MALNIWDFNKYDGIAEVEEQGDYELRIYLKGNANVEVAICSRVLEEDGPLYNLYNFIVDKDHLKNMKDLNWFRPINKITLYIENKLSSFQKSFIEYALKFNVEVVLTKKPF